MKFVSKKFKKYTSIVSLYLQCVLNIVIGLIMICNSNLFYTETSEIIFSYLAIVLCLNLFQIIICFSKGLELVLPSFFPLLASCLGIAFFYSDISSVLIIIPIGMVWWTGTLALSSFISFIQYIKEKNSAAIRYLVSTALHIVFGVIFVLHAFRHTTMGTKLAGLYLILLGVTLFFEATSIVLPSRFANRLQSRIRIIPPALLTTWVPYFAMNRFNEFFDEELKFNAEKDESLTEAIEIFIHVSRSWKGNAGHMDIKIDDKIVCYGTYDKDNIKLGGIVGDGVFYEVYNKEEYIDFSTNTKQEMLFGFEIALTKEQLEKMKDKLDELKQRTDVWKCKAQIAMEKNEDLSQFRQVPCLLSQKTKTVFYKFNSGRYKNYWILGDNCVKFVDELLCASGIKKPLTGANTPGTYFTFLNNEYIKESSIVIKRNVYSNGNKKARRTVF